MKNRFKIILLPLLLLFAFTNANAKWWIFGQNESSVDVSYLYVNSLSFDSTNKELVFSKESLDNGLMHIRGKANAGSSNIGKVLITTDGKKTWQKAKLASDGSFDFSFEPELNKKYDLFVQILDTTGKSNEVDDTHKIVTVLDKNMREIVNSTLNHLKKAYSNEDLSGFMRYVSEDFAGDDTTLELALRKDFSLFDNIQIDFTINSIAYSGGKYFVSITFSRSLESSKDGKVYTDRGITEFNFNDGKNGAMLYSMKNPLIFGLSDAEEVADGSVVTQQNDDVISVSSSGDVSKTNVVEIGNGTGGTGVQSGSFTLSYDDLPTGGSQGKGFLFEDDSIVEVASFDNGIAISNIFLAGNNLWPGSGVKIQDLGVDGSGGVDFNHMSVPTTGYWDQGFLPYEDHVIALKLPDNTYAIMKLINFVVTNDNVGTHVTAECQYKYRDDGGLDF